MTDNQLQRRDRAVDMVINKRRLSSSTARQALGEAYDVVYDYFAPFITDVTAEILADARRTMPTVTGPISTASSLHLPLVRHWDRWQADGGRLVPEIDVAGNQNDESTRLLRLKPK